LFAPFQEGGGVPVSLPSEQKWYALTGRVVSLKVEADGDIHMALGDATGKYPSGEAHG
jgi:hypothetical protein